MPSEKPIVIIVQDAHGEIRCLNNMLKLKNFPSGSVTLCLEAKSVDGFKRNSNGVLMRHIVNMAHHDPELYRRLVYSLIDIAHAKGVIVKGIDQTSSTNTDRFRGNQVMAFNITEEHKAGRHCLVLVGGLHADQGDPFALQHHLTDSAGQVYIISDTTEVEHYDIVEREVSSCKTEVERHDIVEREVSSCFMQ